VGGELRRARGFAHVAEKATTNLADRRSMIVVSAAFEARLSIRGHLQPNAKFRHSESISYTKDDFM
jgi:hypothetical protein